MINYGREVAELRRELQQLRPNDPHRAPIEGEIRCLEAAARCQAGRAVVGAVTDRIEGYRDRIAPIVDDVEGLLSLLSGKGRQR